MQHSNGFLKLVDDAKARIREISPTEAAQRIDSDDTVHLVDVREDSEWNQGHAKRAVHLGKGIIERDIEVTIPDHDAPIILYCGGGYRSALAADALQNMGYRNVLSMAGGYKEWKRLNLPTV